MLVEVTQEDIDNAVMSSVKHCMVAKAMSRAFGYNVYVGMASWWIEKPDFTRKDAPLPEEVSKKIIDACKGRMPEPFQFEVNI